MDSSWEASDKNNSSHDAAVLHKFFVIVLTESPVAADINP